VKLLDFLKKLRPTSVQAGEDQRSVDNIDAQAAALGTQRMDPNGGMPGLAPPNYVPPADEGRPRH
jgi:hypothetical protein